MIFFYIYLILINSLAFILYGIDKRRAVRHQWRISEATLVMTAWLGGAAGALIGMEAFHHKTRKWKFRLLIPLAFLAWIGVIWLVH